MHTATIAEETAAKRRARLWKRRAWVLAVLIGLLAGAILVERFRGEFALKRRLAELTEAGEKLTIQACLPPPVEPTQNAAPILLPLTNHKDLIRAVTSMMPPGRRLTNNGFSKPGTRVESWEGDDDDVVTWPMLDESLSNAAPAMQIVREAMSRTNFDLGVNFELGFLEFENQPTMHLAELKTALQMLVAATTSGIHRRDSAAAFENLRLSLELVDHLRNERFIITQLVRIACGIITVNSLWEALTQDVLSEPQLRDLQAILAQQDYVGDMERCLEMERAMTLRTFERLRGSSDRINRHLDDRAKVAAIVSDEFAFDESGWMTRISRGIYVPLWKFSWAAQDTTRALNRWQEVIELHRRGATNSYAAMRAEFQRLNDTAMESTWLPDPESESQKLNWYGRLRYLVSSDTFSMRSTLVRKVLEGDAEMKLATLAVALARYHLARKRYPQTLDELSPEFITALPVDRVSGRPLGYRALPDGGFLFYSAGRDGVDDGGDASPTEGKEKLGSIWDGRDAVWPRLATNSVVR